MSKTPNITEQELKGLAPCALDEEFLARLTACADETFSGLSPAEQNFENRLRAIKPRAIPSALSAKLEDVIADTPFAVDEKIVLFHKSSKGTSASTTGTRGSIIRFNIAAAAAVAILGSIAALMLPGAKPTERPVAAAVPQMETTLPFSPSAPNLAPASRDLSDTSDEGVIWLDNMQPHRLFRQEYMDRVSVKNSKGETVEIQQPSFEYILIPENVD